MTDGAGFGFCLKPRAHVRSGQCYGLRCREHGDKGAVGSQGEDEGWDCVWVLPRARYAFTVGSVLGLLSA